MIDCRAWARARCESLRADCASNSCPDKTNNRTATCVCVHNTFTLVMRTNHSKNFYPHTTKHRLCDLTCSTQQDFPPVPIRGCLLFATERERERGKWRGMGCTSAWRTHLFNSFSYISAIFFSIMCRHVPATCSPICPVPFCDCLHCFLYFLFFFLFKELSFSVPRLDSTWVPFLRFSSCPPPSHSLTITKG